MTTIDSASDSLPCFVPAGLRQKFKLAILSRAHSRDWREGVGESLAYDVTVVCHTFICSWKLQCVLCLSFYIEIALCCVSKVLLRKFPPNPQSSSMLF